MIRKLIVEDIVSILRLKDDVFQTVGPCELGEWVQYLIKNVDNPRFLMLGVFDNKILVDYAITINCVNRPLMDYIFGIYYSGGKKNHGKILDHLKKWGKECEASTINIITKKPDNMVKYGFVKKATSMSLEI